MINCFLLGWVSKRGNPFPMEQQIKDLLNPLPILISPDVKQPNTCLNVVVHNSRLESPVRKDYSPIVGKAKTGDDIQVLKFGYAVNASKSPREQYNNENHIADVVDGNYIYFRSWSRYIYDYHIINCNGIAVYVMKRSDRHGYINKVTYHGVIHKRLDVMRLIY